MSKKIFLTIAIVGLTVIFTVWLFSFQYWPFFAKGNDRFASCRESTVVGGAGKLGGPFTLVNQNGDSVTDKDTITEPSLIYFGYTFCPDICPLDGIRNAKVVDLLSEEGISATPIFISIDPQRDTPEVMADFSAWIHPKMVGLTGSMQQVKAVSKAYRTYFKSHNKGDSEFYLVDHSTMTYLVLPHYGFVEFFRRDHSADEIAKIVACFVEKL